MANSKAKNPTNAIKASREGKASTATPKVQPLSKGNLKTETHRHIQRNQSGHFAMISGMALTP
jgi:hypothetical protein